MLWTRLAAPTRIDRAVSHLTMFMCLSVLFVFDFGFCGGFIRVKWWKGRRGGWDF